MDAKKPSAAVPSQKQSASSKQTKPAAPAPLLSPPSMPKGGGAIRGIGEKLSVSAATGTAGLTIPLAVSPGRGAPELSLSYSSGGGNGTFGLGWNLSVGAITRKTDKELPRYIDDAESDTFVHAGEDLVPAHDTEGDRIEFESGDYRVVRYRPRVEGAFSRIERWTMKATKETHWRITSRENVTSRYGQTSASRIADPGASLRVFSWLLDTTEDDRGNVTTYEYKAEDGVGVNRGTAAEFPRFAAPEEYSATAQRYLKRVKYGNLGSDHLFEVVFDYGEHDSSTPTPSETTSWPARQDAFSSYRGGFEVRNHRLCKRVLMFHRFAELGETPCLVRSTDFTYEQGPAFTYLTAATQRGYIRESGGTYTSEAMPAVSLDYSRAELNDKLNMLDKESLEGLRGTGQVEWVDLDGDGLPGALLATDRAWYFKANRGEGKLAAPALLDRLPSPAQLGAGLQQLTDLGGDGTLDLVQYAKPMSGYFERQSDRSWAPFAALRDVPNIDWNDPNLRFIDLDGDGHPDLLITEQDAFVWYRSEGKNGFAAAQRLAKSRDENEGPAVVFADSTQSIQLADMSGDGLVDIVRIRNSEVCYWPNLGYGRFGRKVTLDASPLFDRPEQFDARRIRLGDFDGSGTTDLVYLHGDGARVYFNQSGNRVSAKHDINSLPPLDAGGTVSVVDLLGNGTSCLVWVSPLAHTGARHVLYVDPFGGKKPHLLTKVLNNLGAETRITYASSTKFSLADKAAQRPWLTKLSFPVLVVEKVKTLDHVSKTSLVTSYAYHHGYFDPNDREFRGFACVEQWDAETLNGAEEDELVLPPVRTVSWFHTGAWMERERLELALRDEYFEGDDDAPLSDTTLVAPLLSDPEQPSELTLEEEQEAARALKGQTLRVEVYAEDGSELAVRPYSVSERDFAIRLVQSKGDEKHGVFFVHPRHTLNLHYERNVDDPRMQQETVLAIDECGNVTRSAAVAYPRRGTGHPAEQTKLWCTVTEQSYENVTDEGAWYRVGVPVQTRTWELTGLEAPSMGILSESALNEPFDGADEIGYETAATSGYQKRTIARAITTYSNDDQDTELALGVIESKAIIWQKYAAALTSTLASNTYGSFASMLTSDAKYVLLDGHYFAPGGRVLLDDELFYLPVEAIDPFGAHTFLRYDDYGFVEEAEDAVGNVTAFEHDYRVLAPAQVTDPNGNRTASAFDPLGRATKLAVLGKVGETVDTLVAPTVEFSYDLDRWLDDELPASAYAKARTTHGGSTFEESWTYSDGFGREVMKKVQAEPGAGSVPRWVGTGRTVFDNKGNAVKKYEPYFSTTSEFESEASIVETGVTPVLRYDPLGRLIRTDLPDGTHTKVEFDAWTRETYDANDTVVGTLWHTAMSAGTTAQQRAAELSEEHADTPDVAHLDALGRVYLTVGASGSPVERATNLTLDVQGRTTIVTDARPVSVLTQTFDMLGNVIVSNSVDAGETRAMFAVDGQPILNRDARNVLSRRVYDDARRPTHVYVTWPSQSEELVERVVYGEAHGSATTKNLRGKPHRVYDGAGLLSSEQFDVDGNRVESVRRLAVTYDTVPDWTSIASTALSDLDDATNLLLHSEAFATEASFDALGRVVSSTTTDDSETLPTWNEAGLLEALSVKLRGGSSTTDVVDNIDYNARGQRVLVEHANGAVTSYEYDPKTFRLARLKTQRTSDSVWLQDLAYTYDAAGNIVQITDAVSYKGGGVSANGFYEYDALSQLVRAEGREHPGQQPADGDAALLALPSPGDFSALERYIETYDYDDAGNILEMAHTSSSTNWTRGYAVATDSNRLLTTTVGASSVGYSHDDAGNMVAMPHLAAMDWDHANRLIHADKGGGGDVYFTYDASGERVRKVYDHSGLREERIYLGGWEVYRKTTIATSTLEVEREALHLLDGDHRVALVETKTVDTSVSGGFTPVERTRFQLPNHLGSVAFELDGSAAVISYEEFHPYGTTALHAETGEVSQKRYRYAGKERDEESGIFYVSARYYAAWLGRWASSDPLGLVDGVNTFAYCRNSPIVRTDSGGTRSAASFGVEPAVEPAPQRLGVVPPGHIPNARTVGPDGRVQGSRPDGSFTGDEPAYQYHPERRGNRWVVPTNRGGLLYYDEIPTESQEEAGVPNPLKIGKNATDLEYDLRDEMVGRLKEAVEQAKARKERRRESGVVNMDTGAYVSAASSDPESSAIRKELQEKKLITTAAVLDELSGGIAMTAGVNELVRLISMVSETDVVPNLTSERVMALPTASKRSRGKFGPVDKIAMGTGDTLRIKTYTSDKTFVDAAFRLGVILDVKVLKPLRFVEGLPKK